MTPEEGARLADEADRANQDIAAVALVRAMLAGDFWTARGIMQRWDPHPVPMAGGQSFATAVAVAAVSVAVSACGGARDRALVHADYMLDAITAVKAAHPQGGPDHQHEAVPERAAWKLAASCHHAA